MIGNFGRFSLSLPSFIRTVNIQCDGNVFSAERGLGRRMRH